MKHAPSPRLASFAAVLVALATAACSADTNSYPSLGLRPVEKLGFAEPEVKTAVAAPDPALDADIATITTKLAAIATGFARDAGKAEALARSARGAAVGSEGWLTAQSALAQLDDWRAQISGLASEADDLAAARAARLEAPYPALATVNDAIRTEGERQSATITRIQALTPLA